MRQRLQVSLLNDVASTLAEMEADVEDQTDQVQFWARVVMWGFFIVFAIVGLCSMCVGWGDALSPRMRRCYCLNTAASSVTLLIAFVSMLVAAVALGIAIFLASYCRDTVSITTNVVGNMADPSTATVADYYLQCHGYGTAELTYRWPFKRQQDAVYNLMTDATDYVRDVQSAMSPCDSTERDEVLELNELVNTAINMVAGSTGILGAYGFMRCATVSQMISDTFTVVCDDVFKTVTIVFEVFVAFSVIMIALEIIQKCEFCS